MTKNSMFHQNNLEFNISNNHPKSLKLKPSLKREITCVTWPALIGTKGILTDKYLFNLVNSIYSKYDTIYR